MERKLVTIQKIKEVKTHPNADSLDLATVLGWQVVVKRGEFKPGDLCVFFEVDSVLPEHPVFEFMRNKYFRVRTVRFRKELSQGLAMPLNIVNEIVGDRIVGAMAYMEGMDLTKLLGVKKHEVPIPLGSDAKGPFPHFIPKTDEIRVQTIASDIFNEIEGKQLYVSVKMDGTSGTFYSTAVDSSTPDESGFGVCSRNLEIKDGDNPYWRVARKYNLEKVLPLGFAIQGEVCGPGIQKNPMKLTEYDLFVFNVYDYVNRKYLGYDEFVAFVNKLGLKRVPCITDQFVFDRNRHSLNYLLEMAKGKYDGTTNDREGIVIRPVVEAYSDVLKGRLSFKVLNNDYLEKEQ